MTAMLLAGPIKEPVTLDEIKAYLKIEADAEDDLLRAFITTARIHLEHLTSRHFVTQSWRVLIEAPIGEQIRMPLQPITMLTSIALLNAEGDVTDLDNGALAIRSPGDPALLFNGKALTLQQGQRLQLDMVTGYGDEPEDVPPPLRLAIKMVVADWFEKRLVYEPDAAPSLSKAIQSLIAPYRVIHL